MKNNDKTKPLKWIFNYTKKYIWYIVLLSIISGSIALSFIILALVSSKIIDIATGKIPDNIITQFIFLALLIIFQAIVNIIASNIQVRVSGKIEMNIKQGLFSTLLKKQYKQTSTFHSGEILNRFTSDVDIIVSGVVSIIPQVISLFTKIIAGFVVLISIDPLFTAIILAVGILVFFFSRLYSIKFKYLHKECQQTSGKTRSFMQECIENIVVIKSFVSENPIKERLYNYQIDNYNMKVKRNAISNLANTGVYVLFTAGYYAALAWGALQISANHMTFGTLTAFLQIIEQIKAPFRNMSGLIPQYYSTIASVERLQELEFLDDEPNTYDTFSANDTYNSLKEICFSNISFSYNKDKIFENANLNIKKGEIIAIAGTSGIGKSTLMKLLLGLITIDSGDIYLNTTNGQVNIDARTRKMFAYVPQGNMILSGTIRENISFCNPKASDKELITASKTACIWDFIDTLPDRLDTVIGERGLGLSEGQIQRISIARAILSDAPILLLDESTSALDEITEKQLLTNLKELETKTVIFISHKLTTISKCDRVIKIENKLLSKL